MNIFQFSSFFSSLEQQAQEGLLSNSEKSYAYARGLNGALARDAKRRLEVSGLRAAAQATRFFPTQVGKKVAPAGVWRAE